jgi:hypothetical protein
MMQESLHPLYADAMGQFVRWINQSTALAECVDSWLMALRQVHDVQAVLNAGNLSRDEKVALFLNGRNAAQDLQAIAAEGGFEIPMQVFYSHYVQCCRALLCLGPSEGGR